MTVGELIDALSEYNPELRVELAAQGSENRLEAVTFLLFNNGDGSDPRYAASAVLLTDDEGERGAQCRTPGCDLGYLHERNGLDHGAVANLRSGL